MHVDGVEQVTPREAEGLLRSDRALLLDVRDDDEWEAARIQGALHIPVRQLKARHTEVPRDRTVVCQCAVGSRSQWAATFLMAQGHPDVRNLIHGLSGWAQAGLPVETDPPVGP
ncbi:MAG TPA: rhodanese-like domain-containing protein [Candidatus Thermoplasmatota archaeon]|nr:rhodanese-like domain-containing protein [Candidatus Thermoplasmatota archaeon]